MNKKKELICLFVVAFIKINVLFAQDVTTVNASNNNIADNLDLEAVASIFGDSKDLEDFEKQLNDPKKQISNLDLNEDNNVDYLRVVETAEKNTHVIAIQAVLGKDIYQDVATIEVEKESDTNTSVQVVGDVFLYGPNYIIEPVYVHRPVLFSLFWRPYYRPYVSVFYWGYYPKYFHFWRPHRIHTYKKNVHIHINIKNTYVHTHVRKSRKAITIHNKIKRNDFAKRHPNKSYNARVIGINKPNGTKKRITGINKSNGDKYRAAGVNKPNGTKKRVVGVNKADGTKKRVYAVKKPNGNKKVVKTTRKSKKVKKGTKKQKRK